MLSKHLLAQFCFHPYLLFLDLHFFLGGFYKLISTNGTLKFLLFIIFGTVFSCVGIYFMLHFLRPRVFNKNSNFYYKGFTRNPDRSKKNYASLNRIVALQIIGETITDDDGDYKSFELNIVLDDASRLNVIDHGNLNTIIDDTEILSDFLNAPIWHAKSNKT